MTPIHVPVMWKECRDFLITERSGAYFDGTVGFGGHLEKFLPELNKDALYIGTDSDDTAKKYTSEKFAGDSRIRIYDLNFTHIDKIAILEGLDSFTGIFADLGVSSYQLDSSDAGFTYRAESDLDMRMNKKQGKPASYFINSMDEGEIIQILREYGEEHDAKKVAREIIAKRTVKKITTTTALAEVIEEITPPNYLFKRLSRVFQAFRILVNDELGVLREFLVKSVDLLAPGGRIAILTYHSLEDRIVKEVFRNAEKGCICPPSFPVCVCGRKPVMKAVVRKPLVPSAEEISFNNRARSAKLRVSEKL